MHTRSIPWPVICRVGVRFIWTICVWVQRTHQAVATTMLSAIIAPASHFDVDALTLRIPSASRHRHPVTIHPTTMSPISSLVSFPFLSLSLSSSLFTTVRQCTDTFMRMCVLKIYETDVNAVCMTTTGIMR